MFFLHQSSLNLMQQRYYSTTLRSLTVLSITGIFAKLLGLITVSKRLQCYLSGQLPDADVIPLQYLGVTDMEMNSLSLNELMQYALANTEDKSKLKEGGYAV
ncbi:hypothetical protein DFH29DRAFT_879701 [Suillus ampliporus]|nr:hypothetical protein DFH29DRAFT_879701 [Suillus ampliporus]